MDPTAWIMTGIAVAGCLLTSVTLIVRVTNIVSSIKPEIAVKINEAMKGLKQEFQEENDSLRHELAETLKPIQTHIALYEEKHYKLELYIRDNYIEVDTFQNALTEIKELITDVRNRVEKNSDANLNWRKEVRDKGYKT